MKEDSTIVLKSGRSGSFFRKPSSLLAHHFVLSFPFEPSASEAEELFGIGLRFASERSLAIVGRPDSYTIIFSGHAARRAVGWHLHVVVLKGRFEKAWFYFVLCGKNLLQAIRLRRESVVQLVLPADVNAFGISAAEARRWAPQE